MGIGDIGNIDQKTRCRTLTVHHRRVPLEPGNDEAAKMLFIHRLLLKGPVSLRLHITHSHYKRYTSTLVPITPLILEKLLKQRYLYILDDSFNHVIQCKTNIKTGLVFYVNSLILNKKRLPYKKKAKVHNLIFVFLNTSIENKRVE